MIPFDLLRHSTQFWIGLISLLTLLFMACGGGDSPIIRDAGTSSGSSDTPINGITLTIKAFPEFFDDSLPDPSNPALLALFSSTFMHDGRDCKAFLSQISQQTIGFKFTDIVVDSIDTETGIAQVHLTPVNGAGVAVANGHKGGVVHWQMKRNAATGIWQINGNQRRANVMIKTFADKQMCTTCAVPVIYSTGLWVSIDNQGAQAIGLAVVTGAGLPATGVTLVPEAGQTWFSISTPNPNNSCTECSGGNIWNMADPQIAEVMPNSLYTVNLYNNASVLMASYTEIVPVRPVLNTALATLDYPTISGMDSLRGAGSATLNPTWTIPAGQMGDILNVYVMNTNTNIWADLTGKTAASGQAKIVITASATDTWTIGNYWINTFDQYGGKISAYYN